MITSQIFINANKLISELIIGRIKINTLIKPMFYTSVIKYLVFCMTTDLLVCIKHLGSGFLIFAHRKSKEIIIIAGDFHFFVVRRVYLCLFQFFLRYNLFFSYVLLMTIFKMKSRNFLI